MGGRLSEVEGEPHVREKTNPKNQTIMQTIHKSSYVGLKRALFRVGLGAVAACCFLTAAHAAQVVIHQEGFETDGEGVRWTSIGRGVSEDPASGPAFWGLNYGPDAPSFVGVRAIAPAKRAAIVWHSALPAEAVTEDALKLIDGIAAWLADGRASRTVIFSPSRSGTGDDVIFQRLTNANFTVVNDDETVPPPDPATIAFVIYTSTAGADPTRFTTYQGPLLTYNAANHDDELVSSIGATVTTTVGPVTVRSNTHPIAVAGAVTGSFVAFNGEVTVDTIGGNIPAGSAVVTYDLSSPFLASTLADVDGMISGAISSVQVSDVIPTADLFAGEAGRWNFIEAGTTDGNPVPGAPDNAGTYGVRGVGRFVVAAAGTFRLAFGVDDAARLRIDLNQNGFDAGDTVFNEEDGSGFRVLAQDVTIAQAGTYDFEWVTLSSGNNYGQEISVAVVEEAPVDPWFFFDWQLLSKDAGPIYLENDITVTSYVPTAVSVEQRPFLVAVNGGSALLGGPLRDQEGSGFWGGADLNDVDFGTPSDDSVGRFLTLQSVDVRGLENLQLVVALAGSDVDFEANDFLKISVDPDGAGAAPFGLLGEYRGIGGGPMGDTLANGTPVNYILRGNFKDVTYNLPAGATDLVIRFEAHSTFFNEVVGIDNVRILAKGPDAPTISIRRNGANVEVEFTGVLQSSGTVDGAYTDVAGATSPVVLTPAQRTAPRFYRSRNP